MPISYWKIGICSYWHAGSWNAACDDKKINVGFYLPSLKDKIGKLDGSFVFDIYEILGG